METTRPPVTASPLDERRGADEELFRFTDRRRTFRTSEGSNEEGNKAYRQGAGSYHRWKGAEDIAGTSRRCWQKPLSSRKG